MVGRILLLLWVWVWARDMLARCEPSKWKTSMDNQERRNKYLASRGGHGRARKQNQDMKNLGYKSPLSKRDTKKEKSSCVYST